VYGDVVMWIYEAQIQYCGIDNKCTSPMTSDKDIGRRLNEDRRKIVKSTES